MKSAPLFRMNLARLSRLTGLFLLITAIITFQLLLFSPVYAANITVDTTADELNNDGDCSLREAVQAANTDTAVDACLAGSGTDTIILPTGTYTLSLAGRNENANATGDLDITGSLTITGTVSPTTRIPTRMAMVCPTAVKPATPMEMASLTTRSPIRTIPMGMAHPTIKIPTPTGMVSVTPLSWMRAQIHLTAPITIQRQNG